MARKSKTLRLFHATDADHEQSILEKGLISRWEGVYLTDTAESAARWIGFRLQAQGKSRMIVVEVEVNNKDLEPGTDHSPLMEKLFGVGKSLLHAKPIPPEAIKEIHYYGLNPALR